MSVIFCYQNVTTNDLMDFGLKDGTDGEMIYQTDDHPVPARLALPDIDARRRLYALKMLL